MRNVLAAFAAAVAAELVLPGIAAHADDELPSVTILPCTERCAAVTRAQPITHPFPVYPTQYAGWYDTYVEGVVQLQYTVGEDGHVNNVAILHLIGPKQFADITAETVKSWVYKPAESNGKPIAVAHKLMMIFSAPHAPQGARPEIARTYRAAIRDIKDGKLDEAFAKLNEAQFPAPLKLL